MKRLALILLWSVAVAALAAPAGPPLRIGVFAYRPKPQVLTQWQPLAAYLQVSLGRPVELTAFDHAELNAAAAQRAVDVVITTPNHFILLQQTCSLSAPLATVVNHEGTNELTAYGGVILVRAERADIASLADLAGKRIAVAATDAFGGYQMQVFEMLEAGVTPPAGDRLLVTGQPHDRVVEALLAGRADAGFVRAGLLEILAQEGKLDPARFKVINRQNFPDFPYLASTRLYPEWPVAVMPQADKHLASRLAGALFLMPPNTLLGDSGTGVCGFTIPANYTSVENLLRRLHLPPFDRPTEITLADLWHRYATWLAALGSLLLLLAATSVTLVGLYRRSLQALRDRQRAEAAQQESEIKYRIVADNTYDWEFWQAPDGQMLYSSPSCQRITGHEAQEFLDDPGLFRRIIHPDDQARYDRHLAESHQRQGPSGLEYRVILPDGTVRWIEYVCQAVFDHAGNWLGRRGSNRNITERKHAEAALVKLNQELEQRVKERTAALQDKSDELLESQRALMNLVEDLNEKSAMQEITNRKLEASNKELEAFSYSVSHDLRAPLRSIDGFSRALLDDYADKLDAEGQDNLRIIRAASKRMAQLIDDLLQLARISRTQLRLQPVDLSELSTQVVGELQKAEPHRRVEFIVEPACLAVADPNLLRIVLDNLIGNAWKFTGKKAVARIQVGQTVLDGNPVYFVRDNGAGFVMEHATKLFGAFQRLHTTEEFPGTGVGLASVQRVIHRHGGKVWIEGQVDEGATVYFTLPEQPKEQRP